ncbi:hypothetical protein ACTNDY_10610 [Tissierellaceae bacterium HCP3S3_D8]
MSKIIDISAKLVNERPKLKLADDKIYEIDDRKNTILKMNQKMNNADLDDLDFIDDMLKMLLGEGPTKEINEMNLSMSNYRAIIIAIMAAITGEEYEVAEKRFRQ